MLALNKRWYNHIYVALEEIFILFTYPYVNVDCKDKNSIIK